MATTVNTRRRRYLTFMTAILAVSIISVASAAWLANGDGSGFAQADMADDLTTEALASITTETLTQDLYPGSDEGDLVIEINNPNRYEVTIDSISQTTATAATVHTAGPVVTDSTCDPADVTLDTTSVTWVVPAEGTAEFTLLDVVNMAADAGNQCQGTIFEIPVTFSGASSAS